MPNHIFQHICVTFVNASRHMTSEMTTRLKEHWCNSLKTCVTALHKANNNDTKFGPEFLSSKIKTWTHSIREMDDTTVNFFHSLFVPTSGFTPSRDTSSNEASSNMLGLLEGCNVSIPTSSTPAISNLTPQSSGLSISPIANLSSVSPLFSDASFKYQSPIQQPDTSSEGKGSRKRKLDHSGDKKKRRRSRRGEKIFKTWHAEHWIKGRGKTGYKGVGEDKTLPVRVWRAKFKGVQKRFELQGDAAECYYRMSKGIKLKELS